MATKGTTVTVKATTVDAVERVRGVVGEGLAVVEDSGDGEGGFDVFHTGILSGE